MISTLLYAYFSYIYIQFFSQAVFLSHWHQRSFSQCVVVFLKKKTVKVSRLRLHLHCYHLAKAYKTFNIALTNECYSYHVQKRSIFMYMCTLEPHSAITFILRATCFVNFTVSDLAFSYVLIFNSIYGTHQSDHF